MADNPVTEFVMITGASTEQAIQILETVNYNVEEAVNLFFASQDAQGAAATNRHQSPAPFPSDAMEEDYIPPPRETTRQDQLLQHPGERWGIPDWRRSRQEMNPPPPEHMLGAVLGRLFHPPDYCFHGTLDQAKSFAVKEGKWLLVNITEANDFHSQRLNRDTWSNDSVTATVVPYFVFWQQDSASENGALFTSLYHIQEAPTCVILDPRTGEAVTSWVGFLDHNEMADKLTSFLDRNSLDDQDIMASLTPASPVPALSAEDAELQKALLASAKGAAAAPDEDAELAQAIAASMAESSPAPAAAAPPPPPPVEWKPSVDLGACFSDNAADGFGRIAIQLANSTNCRKHVKLAAPATALFEFVRAALPEAQTRPFKLLYGYPPKPVPDGPGDTVESAKLQNERVSMVWE